MTMTEAVAKTMWCPHARVPLYATRPMDQESPAGANRPTLDSPQPATDAAHAATRCLGSVCMAWRWAPIPNGTGYCGLAGQP